MRGAGQAQDHVGGQPVAELGVDVVGPDDALGQLGPGVGRLVGEAGPTEHGDPAGPVGRRGRSGWRRPRSSSASVQRTGASSCPRRARAARSGGRRELTASKPNRPLSQSQDQLTGSVSTPWKRRTWLRHDCTAMRQPTEQPVQVDSTSSRSHGRAWNRYGLAVSAPTGQICTVLPEKYEQNGSSGKVLTSVRRSPVHEVDQRVAGHLLGEAGAPVAQDAALAVEVDRLGDGDRLGVVPLLLDPARLARAVGHGLVLQRALAALVAHRAVERDG